MGGVETPPGWWGWKLCLDHCWITMTVGLANVWIIFGKSSPEVRQFIFRESDTLPVLFSSFSFTRSVVKEGTESLCTRLSSLSWDTFRKVITVSVGLSLWHSPWDPMVCETHHIQVFLQVGTPRPLFIYCESPLNDLFPWERTPRIIQVSSQY
jgi:hypothetical protein